MATKKKAKPPTAAEALAGRKLALENAIMAACSAFERESGLLVGFIRHPRDDDRSWGPRELKPEERVEVAVFPPFVQMSRMR